jgi:hypothetical protein
MVWSGKLGVEKQKKRRPRAKRLHGTMERVKKDGI